MLLIMHGWNYLGLQRVFVINKIQILNAFLILSRYGLALQTMENTEEGFRKIISEHWSTTDSVFTVQL